MLVVHENNLHSSSHPKLAHTTSNLATRFQKSFGPTNIIMQEKKREIKERDSKKERKKKKRKWEVKKRES
jgi:hypothetical protein